MTEPKAISDPTKDGADEILSAELVKSRLSSHTFGFSFEQILRAKPARRFTAFSISCIAPLCY